MGHVLCSGWLWITSSRLAFQQCNVVFTHEYKDCLLRCHYSRANLGSTAIQGICCTYKKVRGGGGHPRAFSPLTFFPCLLFSWLVVLLGDYSCCASPRSHCLLFDPLQACKNRGGRKAWEHLSHVWCQWVCTCVATKMTSSSLGHTEHPVTTFITHSCQHDTRPLHYWPPHSNELGECRTLWGKPE